MLVYENKTIVIRLNDTQVPSHPDSLKNANGTVQQRFYDVVKYLSRELHFGLSLPQINMDMHIAKELPELKDIKTGKVRIDEHTWIDDSLKGRPEIESDRITEVVAKEEIARLLPPFMVQVAKLVDAVNKYTKSNVKLIEVHTKSVVGIAKQTDIQTKLLKKLSGEYEPPPEGEGDDKLGYA